MPPYEDVTLVAAAVRALLPEASDLQIERAAAGVSTIVYRIGCPAGVNYLRIHPEPGATFAAEAAVHRRLGARTVYSGIIDFGEIRGAHWLYDLGHFAVEGERLLPHLLEGYGEITPLTAADLHTLRLTSLLIAARRIGRRLQQQRTPHGPDVAYLVTRLGAFDCDRQR